MYDVIANAVGTDGAVQITGGEPTCRKDLPEIVRMGRQKGFWGIEVNTNGLVIAARDGYLEELVAAGLTGVYLSFDGLTGEVYEGTCGRDILDVKLRVVERCREAGIQVVLSVAVVAGAQRRAAGRPSALLRWTTPTWWRGWPCSRRSRRGASRPTRALPMSAGDVIFQLAEQSEGLLEPLRRVAARAARTRCATRACSLVQGDAARGRGGASVGVLPGHARA